MTKVKLDQKYSPYQMAATIIGTIVDNKPNFMLCTWISRLNRSPPIWMASINVKHLTLEGIKKNRIFSMNFPSVELLKKTDYIGITSGRKEDKSQLFKVFYGDTKAPMIEECTINIELEVNELIELPDHYIVYGTAINTFISEDYLTENKPDVKKMNPIVYFGIESNPSYWSINEKVGDAFKIGREFEK